MTEPAAAPPLRVLVVDDERLSRVTTVRQLLDAGFVAESDENAMRALERLAREPWDVVLCDLRMPGMDGIELLRAVRAAHSSVEVLLMTAYGTVASAVEAMQQGAVDYITKPFHVHQLEHRLRRLAELRGYRDEVARLREILAASPATSGLLGLAPGIVEARHKVQIFAPHAAPVLVIGETGTGKELVARALHDAGPRQRGPFVAVPCGAIPESLAESELFGHERGAFTGATAVRHGAFERADRGTLLLDDVDDLPLALQVKLLRVLQDGSFTRVGGHRELKSDVRVVATTKIDLEGAVRTGRFRDDLYYRLRGLEIGVPPLRARGEDILLLAQHFLTHAGMATPRAKAGAATAPRLRELTLDLEAAAELRRYPWPGNVRELRHAMESVAVLCPDGVVGPAHLPSFLRHRTDGATRAGHFTLHLEGREHIPFAEVVHEFEQGLLQWALAKAAGQQTRAAELLGLARTTLQSKLHHDGT